MVLAKGDKWLERGGFVSVQGKGRMIVDVRR